YSVYHVTFMRYLVHIVILLPFIINNISIVRSQKIWLQILRATALCFATLANFYAIQYISLTQSATVFFTIPFIVALLAIPILNERIGARRWIAIIIGFIGVTFATKPEMGSFEIAHLAIFFAALALAIYQIITRVVAGVDSDLTGIFYAGIGGLVILTPFQLTYFEMPFETWHWILFIICGLGGLSGHYVLFSAHRFAPAPVLAPCVYVQIIYMALFEYLVFANVPAFNTLLGALLVIASGLFIWLRERAKA
ncbi:MAG: DMT family transporter, partial [Pseudomonadota bacterium]